MPPGCAKCRSEAFVTCSIGGESMASKPRGSTHFEHVQGDQDGESHGDLTHMQGDLNPAGMGEDAEDHGIAEGEKREQEETSVKNDPKVYPVHAKAAPVQFNPALAKWDHHEMDHAQENAVNKPEGEGEGEGDYRETHQDGEHEEDDKAFGFDPKVMPQPDTAAAKPHLSAEAAAPALASAQGDLDHVQAEGAPQGKSQGEGENRETSYGTVSSSADAKAVALNPQVAPAQPNKVACKDRYSAKTSRCTRRMATATSPQSSSPAR